MTGEAVWEEDSDPAFACRFRDLLPGPNRIGYGTMRSLAGHAFHLLLFGEMLLYVLSSIDIAEGAGR